MKPTVHIHQSQAKTHLPTHELAARRERARAAVPSAPRRRPQRPSPPPAGGRKTVDTRWAPI